MTKPRLVTPELALPKPPESYDPKTWAQAMDQIKQHFAKTQPVQQRQTVTGAKGGNAALTSLLTALATLGFITDSTT